MSKKRSECIWFNNNYDLCSISGTINFLNFLFYFYWKSDIQRGGETERKICSLIRSQRDCIFLSCADPKPGAQSLFWVSCMGAESQGFILFSNPFPGHRQGDEWEARSQKLHSAPNWDLGPWKRRILTTRILCLQPSDFLKGTKDQKVLTPAIHSH